MTILLTNHRERTRFLRFAMVGVIGAIVDFGTFNLLTSLLKFQAVPASVFSFMAAVTSNFFWNRFWTYPDSRSKPVPRQVMEFTTVSAIGLAIRTPLIAVLILPMRNLFAILSIPFIAYLGSDLLGRNMALASAVVVVMFWNFFINRYWTYGDVD